MQNLETAQQVIEYYKKWYSGLQMPLRLSSKSFAKFAASMTIANEVVPKIFEKAIISVVDSPSGFTDGERVGIPTWYFSTKSFVNHTQNEYDMRFLSLALLNGTTTHEALHIKNSVNPQGEANMEWLSKSSRRGEEYFIRFNNIATHVMQVTEDLYIESLVSGTLKDVLIAKNTILIPSDELDNISNSVNIQDCMNAITSMKNIHNRGHQSLNRRVLKRVTDAILKADIGTERLPKWRSEIMADVMDILLEEFDVEEMQRANGACPKGEDITKLEIMEGQGEYEQFIENVSQEELDELTEIEQEFIQQGEKRHFDNIKPIILTLEEAISEGKISGNEQQLPNVPDMRELVRALQFRQETTELDEPTRSGPVLQTSRLSRYMYDDKMFGHRTKVQKDRPEISIMLDMSGSMNYKNLWSRSLATAEKLHKALGYNPHIIMSHTTTRKDEPLIVKLAGVGMGYANQHKEPFKASVGAYKSETIDGLAIREACKQFTPRNNRKILIMICDGKPNCSNISYTGEVGIEHTKGKVEEQRKRGIEVVSISLTQDAKEHNDVIYGRDYNVDATNDMHREVERVFTKLV